MSEDLFAELQTSADKVENKKRNFDDAIRDHEKKRIKRSLESLIKPSRTLFFGADHVRAEARDRLCHLLTKFVTQQNWVEASSVLCSLLKGTGNNRSPKLNRLKYAAAMEVLQQTKGDCINPNKTKNIYDTWMKKIGSTSHQPEVVLERYAVHVEFILLCLTQGNLQDAYQAALSLMPNREFGKDPMANMIVGLTYSQLWYTTVPKQMLLEDVDHSYSYEESDMSESRFSNAVQNSGEHGLSFGTHNADSLSHYESETSVMVGKVTPMDIDTDQHRDDSTGVDINLQRVKPLRAEQPHSLYLDSAENIGSEIPSSPHEHLTYGSIFSAHGLDSWLLPIKLPSSDEESEEFFSLYEKIFNSYYEDAVKYLKSALHSAPPITTALLPLVQLLLIGNHVGEALNEVENLCTITKAVFPFRIRANILDSFDNSNHAKVSSSFEDVLKKDPTCSQSLARLVSMHQNGNYDAESLLEMIALHLDATFAEHGVWRELALCFLKVSHCEEDRLSACLNENEDGQSQRISVRYNRIPEMFVRDNSRRHWKLRYRWWMTRHFSSIILESEILAGELELVAYKAACASHIYGQEFNYVAKTNMTLDKNRRDLKSFLQMHMRYSIRLDTKFEQ